jgi:hypothetical protein
MATLRQQLDTCKASLSKAQTSLKTSQTNLATSQTALVGAKAQLATSQAALTAAEGQVAQLTAANSTLTAANSALIADKETLTVENVRLIQELSDCRGGIPPEPEPEPEPTPEPEPIPEPPPEPPPIGVVEPYPANPAVVLSPGDNIQSVLASGKIVELKPGVYGDQRFLNIPGGTYLFCRDPAKAVFKHVHAGLCKDHPFIDAGGSNITLRGFIADGYSALPKAGTESHYEGQGSIRITGDRWLLADFEMRNIADTAIRRVSGSGHRIERFAATNLGRYFATNASNTLFRDGKVRHVADGVGVPGTPDDNGWCKFAAGSTGVTVDTLDLEDIDGNGVWWDGRGKNGIARNITARRVTGNVVSVEICDDNFLIENISAEDCCNPLSSNTSWPVKAVVLCVLTPNVTVRNVYGMRVGNGVTATAPSRPDGAGLRNLDVSDFEVRSVGRFAAGWAGNERIDPSSLKWRNGRWDSTAKFRAGDAVGIGASQWMALPNTE